MRRVDKLLNRGWAETNPAWSAKLKMTGFESQIAENFFAVAPRGADGVAPLQGANNLLTKEGMEVLQASINSAIEGLVRAGEITADQAKELRAAYNVERLQKEASDKAREMERLLERMEEFFGDSASRLY